MYSNETNQLIELIYESAIKPSKWTELLNALAEFVDHIETQSNASDSQEMLSIKPSIENVINIKNQESNASLSETLKLVTSIDSDSERLPEISQANELLIGHFARALKIAKKLVDLDDQHEAVLSLLDRMPIALVLVNAKSQIIETNTLADELLFLKNGIQISSNTLDAGEENNKRIFSTVEKMSIHDPAVTRGQSLSITNNITQNNIMLFIAPLKQQGGNQKASVAIFISQRQSHILKLPIEFSEQYSLTKKEIHITEQLVRGLSIKEISEESNVSQHTVRSQVKSVMKKTATSRQAELVSLVYNGIGDLTHSVSDGLRVKKSGLLNKTKIVTQSYKTLELDDGRNLAYSEYGDPGGEPVFHCHSIFGSRLELAFNADKIAKQKSVRLIVLDRPGYGASDPNPDASFVNWSKDLVQLADYLNIEKFSLTGYVMGGMYALACAHEIPERLKRVASISNGMVPESSADYKKFIPFYRMNIRLAKYMPKAYGLISSVLIRGALSDPSSFVDQMSEKLGQADRDIMDTSNFKSELVVSLQEAFIQGGKASSKEMIQFLHDWSFELPAIKVPVDLWHGSSDVHQPQVLTERFAEHIKHTRLYIREGHGHYMFFTHWEEILDALLEKE